jgi:RNA polymerase sigma-70 factor (ECF subfamily)
LIERTESTLTDSDEALVSKSQGGDRSAFEELVRRTARLLFARLYLETGDVHRAEDLAQETFLIAWRSIGQVTDAKGFRTWLLAIGHTVVIDAARRDSRKKRAGKRQNSAILDALPANDPSPPEAAQQQETRQKVLSMLRSLPEEYRMPLTLRYIAGADYESIGQQLGLTNGSLRGLLSRGMSLLRSKLSRTGLAETHH